MSFLLEVSAVFGDAQQLLLAHPILAATLTSIIAIPLLFFLFTMDRSPNAPPQMSILLPALMGKFKLAKNGPLEMIRQGYKKYGDIFRVQLAHRHVTFLVGPEAQTLFFEKSDDKNLTQKEVYEFTVPVFGRGIIYDADPNVMLQQLKFVKHGLAGDSMRAHCDKVVAETIDYFNKWQNQGTVNFKQAFAELTILTASRCLLGAEVREHLHTDVAKHYETLEEGMRHITFFAPNFPVSFHRRRNEARAAMAKIFGEVIQKRRLAQAQGAPKQEDFLQHLIDARYRNDQQLTDDEITGLLLAGLFAGQHTSSITSTWMGINILSKKDKLVPRLLEEQRRVLAETGGKLTLDALNKMDLLHACMKETLRMYPPLIMLMRYSQFPQDYKGYTIPKGEILIVSPSVAGRLESVWTNPDEFDPDRFSPERNEGAEKNAYIAFGSGRHACLGEKFGYLQVKTIWSTLLRQFDFEATGPVPPIDYTSLVAAPTATDGVVFNFKRKKDAF